MRNNADQYLDKVRKQLICNKRHKEEILQRLSSDVELYAEMLGDRCTVDSLIEAFGKPQEAAEEALRTESIHAVKKKLKAKKAITCVAVFVCVLIIIVICCLAHHARLKEEFAEGYYVETIYTHTVEGTPPPLEKGDRVYATEVEE